MSYIISDNSITLFHPTEFKPYTFHRGDIPATTQDDAFSLMKTGQIEDAINVLTPKKRLENFFAACGNVTIKGGAVWYNDRIVDNYAAAKALDFAAEGLPFRPILAFIDRVQHNPSYRAVQELYGFLEAGELPLTEDGYFLAYKKVRVTEGDKLVDIYTQKMDNSVGTKVRVPRNQVDENPDQTCSHGLHVCSHSYLPHFGCGSYDKVVVVKVDPADVVAVPRDYNNAKMRCCGYEVLSILEGYQGDRNLWEGQSLNTEFDFGFEMIKGETCDNCGDAITDLDGYDGLCADCADQAEEAVEPDEPQTMTRHPWWLIQMTTT